LFRLTLVHTMQKKQSGANKVGVQFTGQNTLLKKAGVSMYSMEARASHGQGP